MKNRQIAGGFVFRGWLWYKRRDRGDDLKISTKGRYALRLMIDLAQHDTGEYIRLKDISKRQDISIKYLEQIISQLSKAGYVRSIRGPQGGYMLARKPAGYTAGDILRITEGSLAPIECISENAAPCSREQQCTTLPFFKGLYQVIEEYVDGITLEDLLQEAIQKEVLQFNI
jgi:Rrf2 family protein